MSSIAANLNSVKSRLSSLTKRQVLLVAVSKYKSVTDILEAYKAGQRHFGENYVKELVEKSNSLPKDICWHFIGVLQSNKIRNLLKISNLWMIESIDSKRLAERLDSEIAHASLTRLEVLISMPYKVLVQVNVSNEQSKSGVDPDSCCELVEYIINECKCLEFCGLMTIGSVDGDLSREFQVLAHLKKKVASSFNLGKKLTLSMGMSSDYEVAVKMGSNSVRVGTAIFGARPVAANKSSNDCL